MSMVKAVAAAIEDALEKEGLLSGGYLGETDNGKIMVDGTVDLEDLARAAIKAMGQPTPEMIDEGNDGWGSIPNAEGIYGIMITKALHQTS